MTPELTDRQETLAAKLEGMVAVYATQQAAEQAREEVARQVDSLHDLRVITQEEQLNWEAYAPTEPEPTRNRLVALGAAAGVALGIVVAVAAAMLDWPQLWKLVAYTSPVLFALVGATTSGFLFRRYRDDSHARLERHFKNGHAMLLAVAHDQEKLQQATRVAASASAIETISSVD